MSDEGDELNALRNDEDDDDVEAAEGETSAVGFDISKYESFDLFNLPHGASFQKLAYNLKHSDIGLVIYDKPNKYDCFCIEGGSHLRMSEPKNIPAAAFQARLLSKASLQRQADIQTKLETNSDKALPRIGGNKIWKEIIKNYLKCLAQQTGIEYINTFARYEEKVLWKITTGFHVECNYNPELLEIAKTYAQFRTGNKVLSKSGNELVAFGEAAEHTRWYHMSKLERKNHKPDEGTWRWCVLLWLQPHLEHISTLVPNIAYPFGGTKLAHTAAKHQRNANSRKVWIHDPKVRQPLFDAKLDEIVKANKLAKENYEKLSKAIDLGTTVRPEGFEDDKVFPTLDEMRMEALTYVNGLEVPHSERVKTCIESDDEKITRMVKFLLDNFDEDYDRDEDNIYYYLPPREVEPKNDEEANKELKAGLPPAQVKKDEMEELLQDDLASDSDDDEEEEEEEPPKKKPKNSSTSKKNSKNNNSKNDGKKGTGTGRRGGLRNRG